jgi:hypothetical protein
MAIPIFTLLFGSVIWMGFDKTFGFVAELYYNAIDKGTFFLTNHKYILSLSIFKNE